MLELVGIFLMFVGSITVFLIFLNLFTPYGEKQIIPSLQTPVTLDQPQLFEEILASTINSRIES